MPQPQSQRKAPARTLVYAVALAIAGLVAFGASMLERTSTPSPQAASAPSALAPAAPSPVERIYFDAGSAALPAQASEVLTRIADAARAGGASVLVAGFHDHSADRERNLELASQRTQAVAHALEANGVAPERVIIVKAVPTAPGGDEREARRVEMRMQ
jgi:outer membrane protein OmpA-like peptidoglycan-associated protein